MPLCFSSMSEEVLPDWPRALGGPAGRAILRREPEDFQVEEQLGFAADGDGPHWLLKVRKRQANTMWVAQQLARIAGVPQREIGFAGLKDRHAVTVQYFTVPARAPDPPVADDPTWQVLDAQRHRRKLPRGALRGNRFVITAHDFEGVADELRARWTQCVSRGVPNYFGPQRFGRGAGNLALARAAFAGRRMRRDKLGLAYSAARSWLFNAVLAERVDADTWDSVLPGDILALDGSRSHFRADAGDPALEARLAAFDVHPSGPLWGRGKSPAEEAVAALEQRVVDGWSELRDGLEQAGLKQERRSLRLPVRGADLEFIAPDSVRFAFELPAGAFATAVLRELLATDND